MTGGAAYPPLFTPEELAAMATEAAEAQRKFDAWAEQIQTG